MTSPRQRGFTLIELNIFIVVAAVLRRPLGMGQS
jgi:Tfp pilus assembly major pilin PilA